MNHRERIRENLPLVLLILYWAFGFAVVIFAAGAAIDLVYWLMGERTHIGSSIAQSAELGVLFGACIVGAAILVGLAAVFVQWSRSVRPWVLGMAASVGFWGSMALIPPNGIVSMADVRALGIVTCIFGVLFGLGIRAMQRKADESAP